VAVNQQQLDYLKAMGIPVWISRDLEVPDANVLEVVGETAVATSFDAISAALDTPQPQSPSVAAGNTQAPVSASAPSASSSAANDLIRDLQGDSAPKNRMVDLAETLQEAKEPTEEKIVPVQDLSHLGLQEIQQAVASCTACNLSNHRQQTVFARGNTEAKWMFVGDIPRLQDEQEQSPFTGEVGVMLANMLTSLELDPSSVYVTNLMKCRPPLDGAPATLQAQSCNTYLRRQIDLVKPELVILMGRATVQQVLGSEEPMSKLRQQVHQVDGYAAPMVATYHPAYLLMQPRLKMQTWKDLQYAKRVMS